MATDTEARFETSDLMAELRRYLVAVDVFRAEGREPVWRREEHNRQAVEEPVIALPTKVNR